MKHLAPSSGSSRMPWPEEPRVSQVPQSGQAGLPLCTEERVCEAWSELFFVSWPCLDKGTSLLTAPPPTHTQKKPVWWVGLQRRERGAGIADAECSLVPERWEQSPEPGQAARDNYLVSFFRVTWAVNSSSLEVVWRKDRYLNGNKLVFEPWCYHYFLWGKLLKFCLLYTRNTTTSVSGLL